MSLVVNWRGSDDLQNGSAKAPTDTGLDTGNPAAKDASGREYLELRELAVNYSNEDPCLWLRKKNGTLAKFRPTAGLTIVNREADLPAANTPASASLRSGDAYVVRYASDGITPMHRLVVWDGTLNGGLGDWSWEGAPQTFIKALADGRDVSSSGAVRQHLVNGDLQLTTEGGREAIGVYDKGVWHTLFSWDQLEQNHPSLKWAGRYTDLPVPVPGRPIADGASFIIRLDLGGQPLDRLAVWRELTPEAKGATSTNQGLLRADSDPANPSYLRLADLPDVASTAPAVVNQLKALLWNYYAWDGGDYTFAAGDIHGGAADLAGQTIHHGDRLGLVNLAASGAPAQYRWRIGTAFDTAAAPHLAAVQTGEWHFIEPTVWVHGTQSTSNNVTDAKDGDLTVVTEKDHESISVYSNGSWVVIPTTSTETVKKMIASLSLFEGTAHEDGTAVVGAVGLSTLPDLTSTAASAVAAAKDKVGHYWIYVGPDYTVPAVGTGGLVNGLSADLAGAVLRSGEWILIANRGGDGLAGHPAPDIHYVHVPSDLLTYSRSVALYSHQSWTPGAWEQNTLVLYKGSLWRASSATTAADGAPTESGSVAQVSLVTLPPAAATSPLGTVFTVTINGTACSYTTVAANEATTVIGAALLAAIRAKPEIDNVIRVEAGGTASEIRLTAKTAGVPFTLTVTANITTTAVAANVAASPWVKLDLAGGVKFVPTIAELPASAPRQDLYFVLSHSGAAGKGAIVYYDSGASKWEIIGGGGGGSALKLTGGDLMLSVGAPVGSIAAWMFNTPPRGWLICNGAAFDVAVYPELAALIATSNQITAGHVPDLRGCFLRGAGQHQNGSWGDPARVPGSWQNYKTALPTGGSRFKTDRPGNHQHSLEPFNRHGLSNGGGNLDLEENGQGGHVYTQGAGDHDHYITSGGDDETAPRNIACHWIIKAVDDAVVLRVPAAATTP